MIDSSFEQTLKSVGVIVSDFKGTSMNPLLKSGRDRVVVETPNSRLNRGDVALYKRVSGTYVLHRVYKVMPSSYVFWGDNQTVLEYGVEDSMILGVMAGYYKGEKYIDVKKSFRYKLYKAFWCKWVWLRKVLRLPRRVLSKIKRLFSKKS